jgi:dihydrofolate reductase
VADKPILSLIVARARNGVIGNKGALPWHLPADLKHFKWLTVGKPVIMGRKTFESIGKPLPGRQNIVVTRDPDWAARSGFRDQITIAGNLAEAIAAAGFEPGARPAEIMIIGGAQIYEQALLFTDRIYLTEVDLAPDGDAFFPGLDRDEWRETASEAHPAQDDKPAFTFLTLMRFAPPQA